MPILLACKQALISVAFTDVARAAKPRVTSRRAQRAGEGSGTRKLRRELPVTGQRAQRTGEGSGTRKLRSELPVGERSKPVRGLARESFAARATSVITKMREFSFLIATHYL